MSKAILQNWLTSLFGVLAGLPAMVLAYFTPGSAMALSPVWTRWLMIAGGVGVIGLGIVSKAFNTHSTEAQVAASTATVIAVTPVQVAAATAQVKVADAQVEAKK
jgi:hypothetical protein